MNWLWQNSMFLTNYHNNTVSFTIAFQSDLIDQIPTPLHHLCTIQSSHGENVFTYTYGTPLNIPPFQNSDHYSYNHNYYIHLPLIHSNNNEPISISAEKFGKILQKKSIAWYTGAGISASVVPTMANLQESIGIINTDQNECAINAIINALENPEIIAYAMLSFYHQCLHGNSTNAHKAIAQHVNSGKHILVFTENLDMLHEQTGIVPKRALDTAEFTKEITPEILQTIDVMICVGLSHDDKGLLGYYKHHNPNGKIVALCLEKPTYLSETDYFLQHDAQQIIPQLINQ
jgi:NAD-dependent SIR2 family protein deacetylase